jgi:GTPase SAR1 family protein
MIVVFFGQPHSGKSTLAKELQQRLFLEKGIHIPIVDGDEIREIFINKDFSRAGRLRNLQRISDISTFLHHKYEHVIVSAVYPYVEAREYINSINQPNSIQWVYLTYNEDRGRESFHVKDFNYPLDTNEQGILSINTDEVSIKDSLNEIQLEYRTKKLNQIRHEQ